MRAVRGAAASAAAAALAWLCGCVALHQRAMGRLRYADPDLPAAPLDRLPVRTADGLALLAWHLPGTRPAVVVVSGGNRRWAGEVLGIATALQRAGLHVVVHGWRGTPGCDPAPHSLGVLERRDLVAVLEATRARLGDMPLGVLGYSMGGAVALSVAAGDPAVRAVCTDCAFDDPRRVLGEGVRRVLHIPGRLLTVPVGAWMALRYGARMSELHLVRQVTGIAPRPLLLIHGGADVAVPADHARRLGAAAGPTAQLWILDGAGHCEVYDSARDEYVRRVTSFFTGALLTET